MPTARTTKRVKFIPCTPKRLPDHLAITAAQYAMAVNPANRPATDRLTGAVAAALTAIGTDGAIQAAECLRSDDARDAGDAMMGPLAIALLSTYYWGADGVDLSVSFTEKTTAALQNKILSYMSRWGETANVKFRATDSAGDVRISRAPGGYWSYIGSSVRSIPQGQQTMNLEGFVLSTPDSEYERVVCHETGHSLGAAHEHMRAALVQLLDEGKTIAYFRRTQGWSAQEVRNQVLTPLNEASLMATPPDQDSIMCYQLPGSITKNGQPIRGGARINASDAAFMASVYPKRVAPQPPSVSGTLSVNLDTKTVFLPAGWKSEIA